MLSAKAHQHMICIWDVRLHMYIEYYQDMHIYSYAYKTHYPYICYHRNIYVPWALGINKAIRRWGAVMSLRAATQ